MLHNCIHNSVISILGIGYMHQRVIFMFWSFVFQTLIILLPIHQVCVTTGIGHTVTVSLPVSLFVCYRNSSRHNHYPGREVGGAHASQSFAVPSYWRERVLGVKSHCWGTAEGRQLLLSQWLAEGCPEISRRANEHCAVYCCSSIRYSAGAELLLPQIYAWGYRA